MAAKQGITASLYQQTEDAKRAISSKWFSTNNGLNTTCTIKSAPPRTPDVLQLLSCQSGHLLKRNEQHVWQSRWCCIVPHHFLYYFDANGHGEAMPLTAEQQDALNAAVISSGRKQTQARSSLNIFAPTTSANSGQPLEVSELDTTTTTTSTGPSNSLKSQLQPSGIIDLECYSAVHRSATNPLVMELAGDDVLNPELRSFYFVAETEESSEEWTRALLCGRHAALLDEREAYRQVCDGFSEQLQELHATLDDLEKEMSDAKDENYRIRSASEETRRQTIRKIASVLERDPDRTEYRTELETIRNQDLGGVSAVQLLCEYTKELQVTSTEWIQTARKAQEQCQQGAALGNTRTKELEALLEQQEIKHQAEILKIQAQFQSALDRLVQAQRAIQEKQQQAQTQKLEYTMYQSSMKAKLLEVNSHKKLLKKEVIDLRSKLEDLGSELELHKHSSNMTKEQDLHKSEYLEMYVKQMESQVKVQQNMMELMSQHSGYGSQYGNSVRTPPPPIPVETNGYVLNKNGTKVHSPESNRDDEDDGIEETHSQMLRKAMADEDNKSHMSELTEDRTHKHTWDHDNHDYRSNKAIIIKPPPSYIGVESNNSDHRDTINSSAVSLPPLTRSPSVSRRRISATTLTGDSSVNGSTSSRRTLPSGRSPQKRSITQQHSFLANLGKQLSDAIDNSVLGVPDLPLPKSPSVSEEQLEVLSNVSASSSCQLSLAERHQLQRAKQIAFLKEQGLLKE